MDFFPGGLSKKYTCINDIKYAWILNKKYVSRNYSIFLLGTLLVSWWILSRIFIQVKGAQWLSGRVLDSRPRGRGFEPHRRHCLVSLSENINPSLVLVQPRKIRPFITERLLMGHKESNQTKNHTGSFEPRHVISNNVVCATSIGSDQPGHTKV